MAENLVVAKLQCHFVLAPQNSFLSDVLLTFYPLPRLVMAETKIRISHFIAPPRCFTTDPIRQRDRSSGIAQIIPQDFDEPELLGRRKRPQFVSVDWHLDSLIGLGV